jgi:hypothetical protein
MPKPLEARSAGQSASSSSDKFSAYPERHREQLQQLISLVAVKQFPYYAKTEQLSLKHLSDTSQYFPPQLESEAVKNLMPRIVAAASKWSLLEIQLLNLTLTEESKSLFAKFLGLDEGFEFLEALSDATPQVRNEVLPHLLLDRRSSKFLPKDVTPNKMQFFIKLLRPQPGSHFVQLLADPQTREKIIELVCEATELVDRWALPYLIQNRPSSSRGIFDHSVDAWCDFLDHSRISKLAKKVTFSQIMELPEQVQLDIIAFMRSPYSENKKEGVVFDLIAELITHPNREAILSQVTLDQLIQVIGLSEFDKGDKKNLEKYEKTRSFLLKFPQFTHYIYSLVLDKEAPKPKSGTWRERLTALYELVKKIERHGVSDEEMDGAVLTVVARQLEVEPELLIAGKTPSERRVFIDSWRNGLTLDQDLQLRQWRREVNGNQQKSHEQVWQELAVVDEWEDSLHPHRGLIPTSGYEVEFMKSDHFPVGFHSFLRKIGFTEGGGGGDCIETSPGPFLDPRTANLVFKQWIDTGLLDIHHNCPWTFHFNLGTKSPHVNLGVNSIELTGKTLRLMQLTGYAYQPFYAKPSENDGENDIKYHKLRVYWNSEGLDDGVRPHIEAKECLVTHVEGFRQHMYQGVMIAAGQGAFERLFYDDLGKNPFGVEHGDEVDLHSITPEKIQASSLTHDQKELALIWYQTMIDLEQGLKQIGIETYVNRTALTTEVARLTGMMDLLFPTVADYGDYSRVELNLDESSQIFYEGQIFPNPIAFARFLTARAVGKVEQVLADSDSWFKNQLRSIKEASNQNQRGTLTRELYERFPWLMQCGETYALPVNRANKQRKVRELIRHYLSEKPGQ